MIPRTENLRVLADRGKGESSVNKIIGFIGAGDAALLISAMAFGLPAQAGAAARASPAPAVATALKSTWRKLWR